MSVFSNVKSGVFLPKCLQWAVCAKIGLAIHDKETPDDKFEKLFVHIKRECVDERNFAKRAVNWALRQIGKRNIRLNRAAIKVAREVQKVDSKAARWIASDALRELTSAKVAKRLKG